ncbi:hypothetical protein ACFQU2_24930 [Siccirubricoccus deserti]
MLGASVVLVVFGLGPLDPRNQGWLLAGPLGPDPVQLWLGWTYFARAPGVGHQAPTRITGWNSAPPSISPTRSRCWRWR